MEKYTLIITEKPSAAQRIASALDQEGKPEKVEDKNVPYFLVKRDKPLIVVSALGHLYTVAHVGKGRNYYPVFHFKWVPRYLVEKNAKQVRSWIEVISKLAQNAEEFIDACDYDIEGSLIGYCLFKYACVNKQDIAKRMKFSTLTKKALEKSYREPLPKLDFRLIEAGRTRHEVDWLYGINISRALTLAAKRWSGKYATLSTGRVQGSTLKFLVDREKSIRTFVPTPYWSIRATVDLKGTILEVEHEKKTFEKRADAEAVMRTCKGKTGQIETIEERRTQHKPPIPFDLGALQAEAYSLFGYSPRRTSSIAERLYLGALISYPRTSSQKLPSVIGYRAILRGLGKERAYERLVSALLHVGELKPREGPKEDSAHPAVYPTGNTPDRSLSSSERRVWDLVVRRFMAVFGEPAIKQSMKATLNVNGHHFYLRGQRILKEGWMKFYKPYIRAKEVLLPPLKEGESMELQEVLCEDRFTKPLPRYNPSSILKKMEEKGIGTKATRADIIETLYSRKYIAEERIVVSDLGFDIINVLHRYCPGVISVKLTRELEEKMERIQAGNEEREKVLIDAVGILKPILEGLKQSEAVIGKALSEAVQRSRIQERLVGGCPTCHTGKLMVLYSRKTRKRFIGCTNYFKNICRTSFPLPQRGTVKPLHKPCTGCGWPTLIVQMKGRRPWTLCFNEGCPKKEERRKRLAMRMLQQRGNK